MHWPSRFSQEFYDLPDTQKTSTMQNLTTGVFFNGPEPTGERLRDAYRYQTNIAFTQYLDNVLAASHQLKSGFEPCIRSRTPPFRIHHHHRPHLPNAAHPA